MVVKLFEIKVMYLKLIFCYIWIKNVVIIFNSIYVFFNFFEFYEMEFLWVVEIFKGIICIVYVYI